VQYAKWRVMAHQDATEVVHASEAHGGKRIQMNATAGALVSRILDKGCLTSASTSNAESGVGPIPEPLNRLQSLLLIFDNSTLRNFPHFVTLRPFVEPGNDAAPPRLS
jgi:hypothetical protein